LALRRDRPSDQSEWVTLPAEGRAGELPVWPLTKPLKRESDLWAQLWVMPQAVEWGRQGLELTVALYVRRLVVAEKRNCPATAVNTVRQLADSLGLTTPGLRSNRWRIGRPVEVSDAKAAPVAEMESARSRLRVVATDDAGVEGA